MRPGEAFKDNQSFQFQCKCAATSTTPSMNKRLQIPGCQIRFSRKNRLPVLTFLSESSTLLLKRKMERGEKKARWVHHERAARTLTWTRRSESGSAQEAARRRSRVSAARAGSDSTGGIMQRLRHGAGRPISGDAQRQRKHRCTWLGSRVHVRQRESGDSPMLPAVAAAVAAKPNPSRAHLSNNTTGTK